MAPSFPLLRDVLWLEIEEKTAVVASCGGKLDVAVIVFGCFTSSRGSKSEKIL